MKKKTIRLAAFAAMGVLGVWLLHRAQSKAPEQPAVLAPVAEAKTQPIARRRVTDTLDVFGEVRTGQVIGVNFPRAGQVSRLWVIEGGRIKRGTAIATLVSDPAARVAYLQAVHAHELARRESKRTQELFDLQLATRSQLESAQKALEDAEAAVQAQRTLGGELKEETARAPFDGVVVKLAVAQGDRVQPGATIMQMGHTDSMRAHLGIEPDDSRRVHIGMPVEVAAIGDLRRTVNATIDALHDVIDPTTRLVEAVVTLPGSAQGFLVPGMKLRARVSLGSHEAWVVPRNAVLSEDGQAYIFQVGGGKAKRVDVVERGAYGDLREIDGHFDPKLPVVVLGNYELKDGMAVREQLARQ